MSDISFSFATQSDEAAISELLTNSELPDEDIRQHLPHFIVATKDGHLIGCVGLESAGDCVLLRSLAVAPAFRSLGIGHQLCNRITAFAHERGYQRIYLLTTSAEGYFGKRGYRKMDRSEAPEGITRTEQFRTLCPSTAILMKKEL